MDFTLIKFAIMPVIPIVSLLVDNFLLPLDVDTPLKAGICS